MRLLHDEHHKNMTLLKGKHDNLREPSLEGILPPLPVVEGDEGVVGCCAKS
jgi:hypothetical protein